MIWLSTLQSDWLCYKKRKFGHTQRDTRNACTQRRCHVRTQEVDGRLTSQGERSQAKPNLLTPWSWICSLQKCEKINFCCLNHLVCDILLRHPSWLRHKAIRKIKGRGQHLKMMALTACLWGAPGSTAGVGGRGGRRLEPGWPTLP